MMTKIKNFLVVSFYIFAFIGMVDMSMHASGGPCVNPLMYILKGITNESK